MKERNVDNDEMKMKNINENDERTDGGQIEQY